MATLSVVIKEELSLNGEEYGNVNTAEYTVNEVYSRVMQLSGTTEATVLLFSAGAEAGSLKNTELMYLRITNLSPTLNVVLRIADAAQEYAVHLEPNSSYLLSEDKLDANDNVAASGLAVIALAQITTIKAAASGAAGASIEIFAAS
tara:strand:+ start:2563 stop:3003 length:441 start_codon:yes stop_codon:yes gene_type:complete